MRRAHLRWIVLLAVAFAVTLPAAAYAAQPVYRFYNLGNGSHFYTASQAERDVVIARWPNVYAYEGVAYSVADPGASGTVPVYRFYNVRNGSHFYTISAEERDIVIARWPNVYAFEGEAYRAPASGGVPLYRFYNVRNGSHFYTISAEERDIVIARWPNVYAFEGVAYTVGEPVPPAPDWTVVRGYGEICAEVINPDATYDPALESEAIAWAVWLAQNWDTIPPGSPSYVYHNYAPQSVGREPAPEVAGVTWEVYAAGLGGAHAGHNPQLTYCGRLGVAFVQRGGFVYTVANGADYVGP